MQGSGAQRFEVSTAGWSISSHWYRPHTLQTPKSASFGATHVFTPEEALHAIRELTDGRGVDRPIEAAGVRNTQQTAWDAVRTGGNLVVLGKMPVDGHVSLRWGSMMGEKRFIRSSYGGARPHRDFPELVDLYRSGQLSSW